MFEAVGARSASAVDPLRPARFPLVTALLSKVITLGYKLTGKDRYDDFRLERVRGVPILVMPTVLNPKLTRSGAFFASRIDAQLLGRDSQVLDMGTGSGVCALFAARYARRVVAVDINEAAVRCANINARLNHLDHLIDVRHGDLFAPVATEQFDRILFNPPFLRGTPRNDRDRAWRSSDVAERFAAGLAGHLKPGGSAYVLLSTFGEARFFLEEFRRHHFDIAVLAERRFVNERLAIFRLTPMNTQGPT
jgi:methylase of polypeptide subunit release factors